MQKGLIDLKRANAPADPITPLVAETKTVAEPANINTPEAPTAVVQIATPAPQPATSDRISTIGARIPDTLHQSIKLYCIVNRLEMQQFVQDALTNHLAVLQGKNET